MTAHQDIRSFLDVAVEAIDRSLVRPCDWASEKAAARLALVNALAQAVPIDFSPTSVPVVKTAWQFGAGMLSDTFGEIVNLLPWTPSFRSDDGGAHLALCRLNDVFDLGRMRAGFVFVGPNADYPEHMHPPKEVYLTVAGEADWRHGGNAFYESLGDSQVIYNPPNQLHGIKAGSGPVVALYILWEIPAAVDAN